MSALCSYQKEMRSICYHLKSKRENASFTLTRLPSIIPLRLHCLREYVQCILKICSSASSVLGYLTANKVIFKNLFSIGSNLTAIPRISTSSQTYMVVCATAFLGADLDISLHMLPRNVNNTMNCKIVHWKVEMHGIY